MAQTVPTQPVRAQPQPPPSGLAIPFVPRVAWRLAGLASRLPFRWRWRLAQHLAERSMSGPSPGLELLLSNLQLCLPDWSPEQRVDLFTGNATETIFAFLDQFRCWSLSERELRAEVSIENLSILESARRSGPVVLICPHFLGAEFAGHRIGLETRGALVYTAAPHPTFDALRQRARERFGTCRSIRLGGSMLPLVREMRRNQPVLLLPDLDFGAPGSIFTPFFGQPAATTTGPAWCAARFGATIVPVSVRRIDGGPYITTLHPPVEGMGSDIEAGTARINAVIEALVRDNPVQYWWSQPRFARRPEGAAAVYSPAVLRFVQSA